MPDLVTLGELCAVFVARDIGRMRYCRDFTIRPGGAEATVAVGVQRLGFSAGWISLLGNDEMGHYLLNLLRGEGVDVSGVRMVPGKNTSVFLRERLPGGEARHTYYRKDSAFTTIGPDMLDEAAIAGARFLHLTGITPALSASAEATMWRAIEIAKAHQVTVTFDPNVRLNIWSRDKARETLERFFTAADIVLPGLEDLQMLYGPISREEALLRLKDMGCHTVIMKIGDQEVLVFADNHAEFIPVDHIAHPVDLMGAGDAFAAGFLGGLLQGQSLAEAARFGTVVARCAIQMPGNIESMPTRDEVSAVINNETVWKR